MSAHFAVLEDDTPYSVLRTTYQISIRSIRFTIHYYYYGEFSAYYVPLESSPGPKITAYEYLVRRTGYVLYLVAGHNFAAACLGWASKIHRINSVSPANDPNSTSDRAWTVGTGFPGPVTTEYLYCLVSYVRHRAASALASYHTPYHLYSKSLTTYVTSN